MLDFLKKPGQKEVSPVDTQQLHGSAIQEVEQLTLKAKEHTPVSPVAEKGKILKLGTHKVTGKELNQATAHIDDTIIQAKNGQIAILNHIAQLYKIIDSLDAEHIAGILAASKAAEAATDWARVNDENITKIITILSKDARVVAHENAQEQRISELEKKLKTACILAVGAATIAGVSLICCFII